MLVEEEEKKLIQIEFSFYWKLMLLYAGPSGRTV
jgi:hypothetical protein